MLGLTGGRNPEKATRLARIKSGNRSRWKHLLIRQAAAM
jgi:hypothetical protein